MITVGETVITDSETGGEEGGSARVCQAINDRPQPEDEPAGRRTTGDHHDGSSQERRT